MSRPSKPLYEFGPFLLDSAEQLLLRHGQPVLVKPKVFDLLVFLVENSGHLLDKDLLLEQVWPGTFVEEANLTISIFELRKALGRDEHGCRYIETVPRRGYRFLAPMKQTPAVKEIAAAPIASLRRGTQQTSIAVLPFKNISLDGEDQYLGLGMADALITRLSHFNHITVRATSAVRRYAHEMSHPVEAGRVLDVQYIFEGSIQKSDNRLRVTVQLVNVADATVLWAEKIDAPFGDVFELEDSVCEQVANALNVMMSNEGRKCLAKHHHGISGISEG